jgi:hypothetical protein
MNIPMAPQRKPRSDRPADSEALAATPIAQKSAAKGDLIVSGLGASELDRIAEQAASEELIDRVTISLVRREQRKRWRRLQKRLVILLLVIGVVVAGLWAARKYSNELKDLEPVQWIGEALEKLKPVPIPPEPFNGDGYGETSDEGFGQPDGSVGIPGRAP